jgi:hypothetical protein
VLPVACPAMQWNATPCLGVREIARGLSTLATFLNDLLAQVNTFVANEDPRTCHQPLNLGVLLATERAARWHDFPGRFALSPHLLLLLALTDSLTTLITPNKTIFVPVPDSGASPYGKCPVFQMRCTQSSHNTVTA